MSARNSRRALALAMLALAGAGLSACGVQPMPYPTAQNELGQKPGLMSGPTGEFTLYSK